MKTKRILVLLTFFITGYLVGWMLTQPNPHYYDQACWVEPQK